MKDISEKLVLISEMAANIYGLLLVEQGAAAHQEAVKLVREAGNVLDMIERKEGMNEDF